MDDIEVKVHDEINDYKEKLRWFTVRQWIAIFLFFGINVPLYLKLKPIIGEDLIELLVIIISAPIAIVGFIQIQQCDAEKIFPFIMRFYLHFNKPILFKTEIQIMQEKAEKEALKREKKNKLLQKLPFFKNILVLDKEVFSNEENEPKYKKNWIKIRKKIFKQK